MSHLQAHNLMTHMTKHREDLEKLPIPTLRDVLKSSGFDLSENNLSRIRLDLGWQRLRKPNGQAESPAPDGLEELKQQVAGLRGELDELKRQLGAA